MAIDINRSKHVEIIDTPAIKRTIRVSRCFLWGNFMETMKNDIWCLGHYEDRDMYGLIRKVAGVLCTRKPLVSKELSNLFEEGYTICLLGDAMEHINAERANGEKNPIIEIVVTDEDNDPVIIRHGSINY